MERFRPRAVLQPARRPPVCGSRPWLDAAVPGGFQPRNEGAAVPPLTTALHWPADAGGYPL